MKISSKEIARRVSKRSKVPQTTVNRVMSALADEITEAMLRGEETTLRGIGRLRRRCFRGPGTVPTGEQPRVFYNGVSLITSERLLKRLRASMEVFDEVEEL